MDPQPGDVERLDAVYDDSADEEEDAEIEITRVQIVQTRAELGDTLEAIKEKLNPHTLMEQAKESVREATIGRAQDAVGHAVDSVKETAAGVADTARETVSSAASATRGAGNMIVQTIKDNPMPAALAGLGLAWLWMSARQQQMAAQPSQRRYGYDDQMFDEYRGSQWSGTGDQDRGFVDQVKDRASGFVDQAKDRASQMAGQVQEQVGDLSGRVQDRVGEFGDRVQEQVSQLGSQVQDKVNTIGLKAQYQAQQMTDQFSRMLQDNPMAVGAIAMALGAGLGFAVPATPQESRMMGEARDQLVDRAQDMVQDVAQKAQSVVQEAVGTAKEEARNQGLTG